MPFVAVSQTWHQAYMNDNQVMSARRVKSPQNGHDKTLYSQMPGFPVTVVGNSVFKNMRGLALADIDNDNASDIVFAANSTLYVYSHSGLLWQHPLSGTAIYPPSVADMNNDGHPEVVQVTGGSPDNGHIYVFDKDGNVLTGWPVNFNNHWIICAPALADLDNDSIMEIVVCERMSPAGKVHILKLNGTEFSTAWPVTLDGIPAVTPSVADVDNDGEKEIVAYSTKTRYIFGLNGLPHNGFPDVTDPLQKYSYQSPVIADIDNNGQKEIVGSTHGDAPMFYVMNNDAGSYPGWPCGVPDSSWTYSPPAVVKINGAWNIFMSRPIGSDADDMLYGWVAGGSLLAGFPIVKPGGLEGFISVADVNNDNGFDLVFGSNLLDSTGYGFVHAYSIANPNQLAGFPLRPRGWTFMNGVNIGDVDGDNMMELVVLSYTNSFGGSTDSVYINVYELNVPYSPEKVLWGTYKGTNGRTGNTGEMISGLPETAPEMQISAFPNPVKTKLNLSWNNSSSGKATIEINDITGRTVQSYSFSDLTVHRCTVELDLSALKPGYYFAVIGSGEVNSCITPIIKL